MGAFIDLTGEKFERLTVIDKLYKKGNEWYWLCQCDCGNTKEVRGGSLREGKTRSCGCLKQESDKSPKGNVKDLTGQKFGHLLVINREGSDHRGEAKWLCECDCKKANRVIVLGSNLRSGHTMSCGCERRSHGEQRIEQLLQKAGIHYVPEKAMFKFSSGYDAKFDFYIEDKYLIEYDGETLYHFNLHGWHNKENLNKQQERDTIKTQWCKDNNIPLIRIPYTKLKELQLEDLLLETSQYVIN